MVEYRSYSLPFSSQGLKDKTEVSVCEHYMAWVSVLDTNLVVSKRDNGKQNTSEFGGHDLYVQKFSNLMLRHY